MAKATFQLPNGTNVLIEGTTAEVRNLLDYYSGATNTPSTIISQDEVPKESSKEIFTDKKTKPGMDDIAKIINLVKTCPEAKAIGERILDQSNEANRVLVPLYVVHEYLDNVFGLTTTEISEVTIELGAKVSRQNSLRALKFTVPKLVIKQGQPPRYKLHRRGLIHIKSILNDEEQTASKSGI